MKTNVKIQKEEGTDERCCGMCQHMMYEDIDGSGMCGIMNVYIHCGDVCEKFQTFKKSQNKNAMNENM